MNLQSADLHPLAGWRVLVTRARSQARSLSDALRAQGAEVVELPAIEIAPAPAAELDDAIDRLTEYDWVLFTSVNGVDAFIDRLNAMRVPIEVMRTLSVGVIGRGTERRLQVSGIHVDFMPEQFVAESMVEGLVARGVAGKRVLLPRAKLARETLPDGLCEAGAQVDVVTAYSTRLPDSVDASILQQVRTGDIDAITFASPSTVRNFAALLGGPLSETVAVVSIGPITSAALRECGWPVSVQAAEYSIPGVVRALSTHAETTSRQVNTR